MTSVSPEVRVAELEARLEREVERSRAVQEVARLLGSTLNPDELLDLIMHEVTRVLRAERSTLFLVDDARREIWSKVAQGGVIEEIRLRYGEGIAGHVAETGESVNIPDAYADQRFQRYWDEVTGFRTRSVLCVPARNPRGQVVGVLQVLNKEDGPFNDEDEALLSALAGQAAVSLENSKLYQAALASNAELRATQRRLERKMFELQFLVEVERDLAQRSGDAELDAVISRVLDAVGAEAGSILLSSDSGDELLFRWAAGPRAEPIKRFRLPAGQGIAGWVAREGKPVRTADPARDPRYRWPIAEAIDFAARSILCVPLFIDDRSAGAFQLLNKKSGEFTEDDEQLLSLTSGLVARAIQLQRSREAQDRASRLADLGQMLSSILHDLKTPMTVISGFAQLMAQDRPVAERAVHAEAILRQLDHLNAMTREILAFARGESSLLLRKVFVHKFLQEAEDLLAPEFASRGVTLEVEAEYRGAARFDEGKMRRLVHNIARNALEATEPGGRLRIAAAQEGDRLVLTFSDTGRGIPQDIHGRLFESFVTQGKRHGTGLGLAIVKKIVDDHHGEIDFETAAGRGTTFTVRLPLGLEPG